MQARAIAAPVDLQSVAALVGRSRQGEAVAQLGRSIFQAGGEGGFDLDGFPAVKGWVKRVEAELKI